MIISEKKPHYQTLTITEILIKTKIIIIIMYNRLEQRLQQLCKTNVYPRSITPSRFYNNDMSARVK